MTIDDEVIVCYIYIYLYICEAVFIGEIVANVWDDDLFSCLVLFGQKKMNVTC